METEDQELLAITQCAAILASLSDGSKARAVKYLADRFAPDALRGPINASDAPVPPRSATSKRVPRKVRARRPNVADRNGEPVPEIARLVNRFKSLDSYGRLAKLVLHEKDILNRIIAVLALYRAEYGDTAGVTSGEIARFYLQLGVKLNVPTISTALGARANQHVISDSERQKGAIMRYRLSRQGVGLAAQLGIAVE